MSNWKNLIRRHKNKFRTEGTELEGAHRFNDGDFTKLHKAVCSNDLDRVKYHLNKGHKVNDLTKLGNTPLHFAASNGFDEAAKLLVEAEDIDVERQNFAKLTPLHYAATSNSAKVLRILLPKIKQIDLEGYGGTTALHCAAQQNSIDAAKILLANQANVNAKDSHHRSPLHYAAEHGYEEMCKLLLQYEAITYSCDEQDMTPLYLAIMKNHQAVIEALSSNDTNINASSTTTSALHMAAQYGDLKTVKLILNKGANIEFKDKNGQLAVDIAKVRADDKCSSKIVRLLELTKLLLEAVDSTIKKQISLVKNLIDRGACVNACNNSSQSPLFIAIQNSKIKLTLLLLSRGANYESSTSRGTTTLHRACELSNVKIVRALLERNRRYQRDLKRRANFIDAKSSNSFGRTALHIAAKNGKRSIVLLLLKYGSIYNAVDENKDEPLAVAARSVAPILKRVEDLFKHIESKDQRSAIECLNEYPVIVNAREVSHGFTPLVYSMKHKQTELCQFILRKSITDLELLTNVGDTPVHVATYEGNHQVLKSLINHRQGGKFMNAQTTINMQAPLHSASSLEAASILLSNGAIYDIKDKKGMTPSEVVDNCQVKDLLQCIDDLFHCIPTKIEFDQYPKKVILSTMNIEGRTVPRNQNGENPDVFGKLDYFYRPTPLLSLIRNKTFKSQ